MVPQVYCVECCHFLVSYPNVCVIIIVFFIVYMISHFPCVCHFLILFQFVWYVCTSCWECVVPSLFLRWPVFWQINNAANKFFIVYSHVRWNLKCCIFAHPSYLRGFIDKESFLCIEYNRIVRVLFAMKFIYVLTSKLFKNI